MYWYSRKKHGNSSVILHVIFFIRAVFIECKRFNGSGSDRRADGEMSYRSDG